MNDWEGILVALGGNAVMLAVLGFLAKSLIEKLIVRDTKLFESELKAKTNSEIERLKNEMTRGLESYKVRLKKSEVFFLRELEAASAFSSLYHSILPSYSNPDMEWYEACDAMAQDFGRTEARLDDFMAKHGAMLDQEERNLLASAITDAGQGKFEVIDGEVSPEANNKAGEMYEKVQKLEGRLIGRVRAQASL